MAKNSKEYASALFALAKESGQESAVCDGLSFAGEVFETTPGYQAFLTSPGIPKKERVDTIEKTFSGNVPEYVVSFLAILCERGEISELADCISEYKKMYSESVRVENALVTSVIPLTDEEKEKLRIKLEKLSGRKVEMRFEIDESLLGGVTVETDGLRYDGSLRSRLQNIREVMDE